MKWRKRILEDKTEIIVSGILSRYNHDAGKAMMNKTVNFRSTYISQLFKTRNKALTMEEKSRAAISMYNNEIVLYKALLLQCEKDFDLMINVRLYQEIVIPNFTHRHGQFAAVAVVRSGANKLLKKYGKLSSYEETKLSLENMQKLFKARENLILNFKPHKCQLDNKLTNELTRSSLILMLKSKASYKKR